MVFNIVAYLLIISHLPLQWLWINQHSGPQRLFHVSVHSFLSAWNNPSLFSAQFSNKMQLKGLCFVNLPSHSDAVMDVPSSVHEGVCLLFWVKLQILFTVRIRVWSTFPLGCELLRGSGYVLTCRMEQIWREKHRTCI